MSVCVSIYITSPLVSVVVHVSLFFVNLLSCELKCLIFLKYYTTMERFCFVVFLIKFISHPRPTTHKTTYIHLSEWLEEYLALSGSGSGICGKCLHSFSLLKKYLTMYKTWSVRYCWQQKCRFVKIIGNLTLSYFVIHCFLL